MLSLRSLGIGAEGWGEAARDRGGPGELSPLTWAFNWLQWGVIVTDGFLLKEQNHRDGKRPTEGGRGEGKGNEGHDKRERGDKK